jgi:hypothetical protein
MDHEKDTRQIWIDRYNDEAKAHNVASALLLTEKSDHKD